MVSGSGRGLLFVAGNPVVLRPLGEGEDHEGGGNGRGVDLVVNVGRPQSV